MILAARSLAILLVVVGVARAGARKTEVIENLDQLGRQLVNAAWADWHTVETENVRLSCQCGPELLREICPCCESLRSGLRQCWLGGGETTWAPKCEIILHRSPGTYWDAVGVDGNQVGGATSAEFAAGRVVKRRIDLCLTSVDRLAGVLPHELTHVVLLDEFLGRLPRWADEAMAILAEPDHKRHDRYHDLERAYRTRRLADVADLLAGSADWHDASVQYAQAASVASFLIERDSPRAFVQFMHGALRRGVEPSLRAAYGLRGADQLEQLWLEQFDDARKGVAMLTSALPDAESETGSVARASAPAGL